MNDDLKPTFLYKEWKRISKTTSFTNSSNLLVDIAIGYRYSVEFNIAKQEIHKLYKDIDNEDSRKDEDNYSIIRTYNLFLYCNKYDSLNINNINCLYSFVKTKPTDNVINIKSFIDEYVLFEKIYIIEYNKSTHLKQLQEKQIAENIKLRHEEFEKKRNEEQECYLLVKNSTEKLLKQQIENLYSDIIKCDYSSELPRESISEFRKTTYGVLESEERKDLWIYVEDKINTLLNFLFNKGNYFLSKQWIYTDLAISIFETITIYFIKTPYEQKAKEKIDTSISNLFNDALIEVDDGKLKDGHEKLLYIISKFNCHKYSEIAKEKIREFGEITSELDILQSFFNESNDLSIANKPEEAIEIYKKISCQYFNYSFVTNISLKKETEQTLKLLLEKGDINKSVSLLMNIIQSYKNTKLYDFAELKLHFLLKINTNNARLQIENHIKQNEFYDALNLASEFELKYRIFSSPESKFFILSRESIINDIMSNCRKENYKLTDIEIAEINSYGLITGNTIPNNYILLKRLEHLSSFSVIKLKNTNKYEDIDALNSNHSRLDINSYDNAIHEEEKFLKLQLLKKSRISGGNSCIYFRTILGIASVDNNYIYIHITANAIGSFLIKNQYADIYNLTNKQDSSFPCHTCGENNKFGMIFCKFCGTKL